MTQGFFQFNNSILSELLDFPYSGFDILFLSGEKGSGKSETIQKIIPEISENNLVFRNFCFENCSIDDFLLNFYDSFKDFSMNQRISLKKYAGENFKEKMSHYFKTIGQNCIIIIENFEKIEKNTEIIDFISHLASYENVKLIIVSRNPENGIFFTKNVSIQNLKAAQITKDEFKSKMTVLADTVNEDLKEKFYEITNGFELYLRMSVKFSSLTGTLLQDIISEYERKKAINDIEFEEFLVSKFISLTPSPYLNIFKTICIFSHAISLDFIKTYKLGNESQINYLLQNYLLSKFSDELYVKDYFKQYIFKTFTIQEKINLSNKVIKIYESELEKSPKDRLLRISRESMRKEIERITDSIPTINKENRLSFSYLGQENVWKDEKTRQKEKLSEKLNKIKERKEFLTKEKNKTFIPKKPILGSKNLFEDTSEQDRRFIISLINSSREFSKKFDFKSALEELERAKGVDEKEEFKIEILILEAKNYTKLSCYDKAEKIYREAYDEAIRTKDSRRYELEYYIAGCYKNLFDIDKAKKEYIKITNDEDCIYSYKARSYMELGEMEQADSNIEKAVEYYNKALEISMGKSKELVCKCYYLLGVLYDENQDVKNAIKYYKKNYATSSERKENKFYSASLTNLALIYKENEATLEEAVEYFKMALFYDSEVNDYENMYFSQKELAKIYSNTDVATAIGYYKEAIRSAKKLNDNFKIALVYFEAGEFYYDKENDQKALISFLNAKKALGSDSKDENILRIDSRIKDIKIRLDKNIFKDITEKYAE